jgi:predicted secreted protein
MAADTGRDFKVKKAGTVIAGCREDGISLDGSPVDITSKSDSGFRTLASFAGTKALDVSTSGVWIDKVLRDAAILETATLLLTDITLEFADTGTISGDFYLASYDETGSHEDAVTFSASLQSSGSWTYTAAA